MLRGPSAGYASRRPPRPPTHWSSARDALGGTGGLRRWRQRWSSSCVPPTRNFYPTTLRAPSCTPNGSRRRACSMPLSSRRCAHGSPRSPPQPRPRRRGRALLDRAAARRDRPEDPRGPLTQRPGRNGGQALCDRRLRRRGGRTAGVRRHDPRTRRRGGRHGDARLHPPAAGDSGDARPSPARLGGDARTRPHTPALRRRTGGALAAGSRRARRLDAAAAAAS